MSLSWPFVGSPHRANSEAIGSEADSSRCGSQVGPRITAGLVALLAGFGLPATAIAGDEIASFAARWPDAPMRKLSL